MGQQKVCFFDIDGTIWDRDNRIPESAVEAIRALRANGHLAFICSGRARGYIIHPELLSIGFDGIVSGCGTMVEYQGETLFYYRIDNELLAWAITTVRSFGFRPILEGRYHIYMDDEEFGRDPYGFKLKRDLGDRILSIKDEWGRWEASKFSCATNHSDQESAFAALSKDFDFMIHTSTVAEIVPKGFHKGTGVLKVCEILGIPVEDTFGFGDSNNDLGMLQTVNTGIVMGNGQDEVKRVADYVTTEMFEDGIWNACKYYNLI